MAAESALTPTMISYLAIIEYLDTRKKGVRSAHVARALNVSRPSVHSMIKKLQEKGYLEKELYGTIHLTLRGRRIGRQYRSICTGLIEERASLL